MTNQELASIIRLLGETTSICGYALEFGLENEVILNGERQKYEKFVIEQLVRLTNALRASTEKPDIIFWKNSEIGECATCGYKPCMCDQQ